MGFVDTDIRRKIMAIYFLKMKPGNGSLLEKSAPLEEALYFVTTLYHKGIFGKSARSFGLLRCSISLFCSERSQDLANSEKANTITTEIM